MPVTGYINLVNGLTHTEDKDLTTPKETFSNILFQLTSGTGDDQIDLVYHDQLTGTNTLDLYGGLTDSFGTTLNFEEVRLILVQSVSGAVTVGGDGGADTFASWCGSDTDTVTVPAGGVMLLYSPTDGTYAAGSANDQLKLVGTTYNIYIGGTSA